MSSSRFFLSDLDGTLLNSKGELSDYSRRGLEGVIAKGVKFSIASARSIFSIQKLFGEIAFQYPIIEFNGAFLTDYKSGKHLVVNSLDIPLGLEITELVLARGYRPFVCSFNGEEDCLHYDNLINSGMEWYAKRRSDAGDPRLRHTPSLEKALLEQVVSLTVMAPDIAGIQALHQELSSKYGERLQLFCYENEYCPGNWWLTIHDRRASKHIAMQTLRSQFVGSEHQLYVFGDNTNDLEMMRDADHSLAPSNAVPEILSTAKEILDHHDSDCVVKFLQQQSSS